MQYYNNVCKYANCECNAELILEQYNLDLINQSM